MNELQQYVFNPVYVQAVQYQPGVKVPGLVIFGEDRAFADGSPIPTHWEATSGRGLDSDEEEPNYPSEKGDAFIKDYTHQRFIVPEGIWIVIRSDGQMFLMADEPFRRHYSPTYVPETVRTRPIEV